MSHSRTFCEREIIATNNRQNNRQNNRVFLGKLSIPVTIIPLEFQYND